MIDKFIRISNAQTRINVKIVETDQKHITDINFPGF